MGITKNIKPVEKTEMTDEEKVLLADYCGCCNDVMSEGHSFGTCGCCGGDGAPFCSASCAARFLKGKC